VVREEEVRAVVGEVCEWFEVEETGLAEVREAG
jgi:hypothetical protein